MPTLIEINSAKNCYSTGKIAEQIAIVAENSGWNCYIASSSRYTRPGTIKHLKIGSIVSEYVHAFIYSSILDKNGLGSYLETKQLIKRIDEIQPNVIHLHNLHGHYINYKILFEYLKKSNIPVVWTIHDCWAFTGRCAYFEELKCDSWKAEECVGCQCPNRYPAGKIMNRAHQMFQLKKRLFTSLNTVTIVPVSKWLWGLVRDSFLNKYPVLPIYNGIDTDVFQPCKSNLRQRLNLEGKFVMIAVASIWVKNKGLDDYIMLSRLLGNDEQMVLVGVPDKIKKTLPPNIIAISKTENQKELAAYYSMADVVLNLSYQETFGLTTVEGMACGTPAIVYNRTASPELVTSETGLVVEAGNIEEVYYALKEIKRHKRSIYSIACRERAVNVFSKHVCYNQYVQLYNSLYNNRR